LGFDLGRFGVLVVLISRAAEKWLEASAGLHLTFSDLALRESTALQQSVITN